jgi:hypothetical protein
VTPPRPLFFAGADPQQSSAQRADDGGIALGAAFDLRRPEDMERVPMRRDFRFAFLYHRTLRGLLPQQWSGYLHGLHAAFGLTGLALDWGAGGAGPAVAGTLRESRQEIPADIWRCPRTKRDIVRDIRHDSVRPITTAEDMVANGDHILLAVKRGDPGIDLAFNDGRRPWRGDDNLVDALHGEFHDALDQGEIAFLPPFEQWPKEAHRGWPQERIQVLVDAGRAAEQLARLTVLTRKDDEGHQSYILTRNGAKQFQAASIRKDLAYAMIYAHAAFLVWFRKFELGIAGEENGDEVHFASAGAE